MKTLEVYQPATTQVDQSAMNANFCLPSEIIEEIIFRLPVKSILRFRTVSKPWLSCISDPSFTKLHLARATAVRNTALLICTYDHSTGEHRFFSAAHDGGPVTHIMTLYKHYAYCFTEAEHLNGLVFFTFRDWFSEKGCPYVLNPSTHKIFKLPDPACLASCRHLFARYFFGFDESIKEHKILTIMECGKTTKSETMIFSMSNYSWRKIDAEPPIGFRWKSLYHDIHGCNIKSSICVNSVVHLMSRASLDILTFDLRTEKFSMIETPQGVVPHEASTMYNIPWLIKVNGCIGVVCHDRVVQSHELYIWILKDYENRVWVREVVKFPKPWIELGYPHLLDVANMDEIIFYSRKVSGNVVRLLIYNSKSRRFKSLQCTHGDRFLDPKLMWFKQISCYVESIVSL